MFQAKELKQVELTTQFLHSQLPPHYNPRDGRHIGNSDVMDYSVGGSSQPSGSSTIDLDSDSKDLWALEQDLVEARADCAGDSGEEKPIEVEVEDENGVVKVVQERTGVTHLVSFWYPTAHKVRKYLLMFLGCLLTVP